MRNSLKAFTTRPLPSAPPLWPDMCPWATCRLSATLDICFPHPPRYTPHSGTRTTLTWWRRCAERGKDMGTLGNLRWLHGKRVSLEDGVYNVTDTQFVVSSSLIICWLIDWLCQTEHMYCGRKGHFKLLMYRYLWWKILCSLSARHTRKHKNVFAPHNFIPTDSLTDCGVVQCPCWTVTVNTVNVWEWGDVPDRATPFITSNEICWISFFLFISKEFS